MKMLDKMRFITTYTIWLLVYAIFVSLKRAVAKQHVWFFKQSLTNHYLSLLHDNMYILKVSTMPTPLIGHYVFVDESHTSI